MSGQLPQVRWTIERAFDGTPVAAREHVQLALAPQRDAWVVAVDAPFHDDPPPTAAPGSTDGLWDHEVVELFLLAPPDHYLEIELGPHGHYLVLELRGQRNVVRSGLQIEYRANVADHRWTGTATIPLAYVPAGATRANGYAISGAGEQRRYLAYYPVPGDRPDFHRLECFGPLR
ncbi:MAG: hypothetical protein JRI23_26615 [Deltaproteobacteria bacterium]|jgi:hypothetical protein|nr:hypothetical protein [Deltaproteobacteria bacterium]MBW2535619.1 hypothetical protein [Deltaproteobacteria bacterium]